MTNKPMLSVGRELLEELQWHYKPYDDYYHKESGYYCPMCHEEKSKGHDATCEIKAAFDKPAAQHQGEPVAWVISTADGNGADYYPGKGLDTLEIGAKLYAEQPAPVAVVMPERMDPRDQYDSEANQWNACLDEVVRLNGVKP